MADVPAHQDPSVNYNSGLVAISRVLNRAELEVRGAASSNLADRIKAADLVRIQSFLAFTRAQAAWEQAQPEMDWPKTHPIVRAFDTEPDVSRLNNDFCNTLIDMIRRVREELQLSNSRLDCSGIGKQDYSRFTSGMDRVDNYIANVIKKTDPLDVVETDNRDPVQLEAAKSQPA
jgi:hypothetical protein